MSPRRADALHLFATVALVVGLAGGWDWRDRSPPHGDDFTLYEQSVCVADGGPTGVIDRSVKCMGSTPYPPLVPTVAAIHMWVSGDRSVEVAKGSQWIWWALLAASGWLAGRPAGRLAATATPLFAAGLWLLAGLQDALFTELAMAACVLGAMVCLHRSAGLRSVRWAAGAGLLLTAGMLAKWTFAFFAAPAALVYVVYALGQAASPPALGWALGLPVAAGAAGLAGALLGRSGWGPAAAGAALALVGLGALLAAGRFSRRAALGLAALAGTAALGLPWYMATSRVLVTFLGRNLAHEYAGDPLTLADTWAFYPAVLVVQLGAIGAALAGLGLLRQLLPGRTALVALAGLGVLGGLAGLSVSPYRSARYIAPALPLLAPAILLLSARAERWLHPLRAAGLAVGLWMVGGWVVPDGWRPRPEPPGTRHLAGNDRHSMEQTEALLRSPPLLPALAPSAPFLDPPDMAAFLDAAEAHIGADRTTPILLLDGSPNGGLSLALLADVLRRGWDGGARVERLGTPRSGREVLDVVDRFAPRCGLPNNLFVVLAEGRPEPLAEAALTEAGLVAIWDHTRDREPKLRERLWAAERPAPACRVGGSGTTAKPRR